MTFEQLIMQKLGSIEQSVDTLEKGMSMLFKKVEGNGQPGLMQRTATLEEKVNSADRRSGNNMAIWVAIISPAVAIAGDAILRVFFH